MMVATMTIILIIRYDDGDDNNNNKILIVLIVTLAKYNAAVVEIDCYITEIWLKWLSDNVNNYFEMIVTKKKNFNKLKQIKSNVEWKK